jgi:hypothetical protein
MMATLRCPECGLDNVGTPVSCANCGFPFERSPMVPGVATHTAPLVGHANHTSVASQAPKPTGHFLRNVVGLCVLAGLVFVFYKVRTGSSLRTAVGGPETIANETYVLDEGDARTYSFSFPAARRVRVTLQASPAPVNLLLMTSAQFSEYQKARSKLLGGQYHYSPELSDSRVLATEREALLNAGTYTLVVERPRESVLLTDKTTARVLIQGM